jgi:hypothetical protein
MTDAQRAAKYKYNREHAAARRKAKTTTKPAKRARKA